MKKVVIVIALCLFSVIGIGQTVIFLHHSTGGNVFKEGNVTEHISSYNTENGTDVQISERSYPSSPYPWRNYPYDYWNLWINNACDNNSSGIECLESLTQSYDIIVLKHCFPGAGLRDSTAVGDVASETKSFPNYKAQYRALREKMKSLPDNQFIIWTLAPLHRLSTHEVQAARAGKFVDWVKNEWLSEGDGDYPNIHVFDFFGIVAQTGENPEHGFQYSLKYEFERSHDDNDSHPNVLANETVGPKFAEFVGDVAKNSSITTGLKGSLNSDIKVYPNPTSGTVTLSGKLSKNVKPELFNAFGEKVLQLESNTKEFNISKFSPGVYFLKIEGTVVKIMKE